MGTDGGHHMLGGLQAFGCKSGRHRSIALAERLVREVQLLPHLLSKC